MDGEKGKNAITRFTGSMMRRVITIRDLPSLLLHPVDYDKDVVDRTYHPATMGRCERRALEPTTQPGRVP